MHTHTPTRSALALTPLLLLAGCAVGPDYHAPQTAAHDAFHASQEPQPGPSKLTSRPADLARWWETLADPQLESLLQRGIDANLDLKIALARLREVRAQRGVVAADELPTLNAGGAYTRGRSSENTRQNASQFEPSEGTDLYRIGFDASWELDFFGRVRRSVEAADADIGVALEARNDTLLSIAAEIGRNYVELRGFQKRLDVIEFAIQTERDTAGLVEARLKAGLATELDVAQARAQLASRESQRPPLRVGLKRVAHRLGVLTGQEPGALLEELAQTRPIPSVPPQVATGMPADLIRRRPDIRRAERQIAAATARVGVATADLYPRFTLLGDFGFQSSQIGDLLDANSRAWSIGPAFTWPLFDAGRVRSTIKVRDAQLEENVFTYERTVLNAYEEVENAMVSFIQEQDRRASLTSAVESSTRAVELARERYQSGVVDFLNVLDSQRLLYVTKDQLAESEQEVTVNLIALYKALGGGWESMIPAQPQSESESQSQPPAPQPGSQTDDQPQPPNAP